MEVGHNKKTKDTGDEAEEFNVIIGRNTMSNIFGNPLVF